MKSLSISVNFKKIVLVMGLVVIATPIAGCKSSKVIDPSDPRFDKNQFRFEDYKSEDELLRALQIIFPEHTSKQDVDSVLLKSAGLDMFRNEGAYGEIYVVYKKSGRDPSPNRPIKTARFLYNEAFELIDIDTDFVDGKIPPKYLFGEKVKR